MIAAAICNCSLGLITFSKNKDIISKACYGNENPQQLLNNPKVSYLLNTTTKLNVIANLKEYSFPNEKTVQNINLPYQFYAGFPLTSQEGEHFGILSVWNTTPLNLSEFQKNSFLALSSQIIELLSAQNSLNQKLTTNDHGAKLKFIEGVLNDGNLGQWELDLTTLEFKLNHVSKRIMGYDREEFIDLKFKTFLTIVYQDAVAESLDLLEKIRNNEIDSYEHTIRIKHKKGYWSWTKIIGKVVKRNSKGIPLALAGSMQDVHDFKTTELQLNTIIETINCVAFRHIFFKDGTQEIVHITKGASRLLGLTEEDFYKDYKQAWDLVHKDDIAEVTKIFKNAITSLEDWKHEWRVIYPDGTIRWHSGIGKPVKNINGSVSVDTVIIDVTAVKNKEEQLNSLNNKLLQAQKIAKLGYWEFDLVNDTEYWSDRIYDIFGLVKGVIVPSREVIKKMVFEEDVPEIIRKRKEAVENSKEFFTENRIKKPDGTIIWIRQIGNYTKDENGVPIKFEGTIQDITEPKLISLELEESIQRYNYVTKATSDAIWDLDFVKGTLFWGDNYKKTFGHPTHTNAEEDLAYWESNIHPDDRVRVIDSFNLCIEKGEDIWEQEYRFKNITDHYSNVVDRAFIIRNEKGEAIRMVGAIQDVTESIKSIEEVKQSNERFKMVSEVTNDAIWDWDLLHDTYYQGPGYKNLFGYDSEKGEVGFSFWSEKVHPEDLGEVLAVTDNLFKEKTQSYFKSEYRFLRKDGVYAYVVNKGSVLRNDDGEVIRMFGAMQDVTESKMYEASLKQLNQDLKKQAMELSRYNQELEQFAYVVSHDLQEPLRMISSFLMLLEKKYTTVLDEEGKKYIYFAVDGAKRMRQIILDLLDLSKVGRTNEIMEAIDLNLVIAEIESRFNQAIKDKEAQLHVSKMPEIKSYKVLLEQLFQNLIGNALKYHKEGVNPIIKIDYTEELTHHKFSISDNGIGIESQYFDKIFVIFQRLHGRNQYHGTGIGLALVKKIIDYVEGEIWVESEIGKGTTFIFTIKKV